MKCVYVIGPIVNPEKTYKIGKADNSEKRKKGLQTANSSELLIYHTFECNKPYILESYLHKYYKTYRGLGEWFTFDDNILNSIKNIAEKYISDNKLNEVEIKKNNKNLFIVFDKINNPWFNALHIANLLEYTNTKKTIKMNVSKKNKTNFDAIVDEPTKIYKNAQSHSIFINESGLLELLLCSNKRAFDFKTWVYAEILPNIKLCKDNTLSKFKKELVSDNISGIWKCVIVKNDNI